MSDQDFVDKVIEQVNSSEVAFCKFLSTNDVLRKNSHQRGIYIPNNAAEIIMFGSKLQRGTNIDFGPVRICWQSDACKTDSMFKYYGAKKDECRITCFGRGFPFLWPETDVGDLFILLKVAEKEYDAYLLSTDDEIEMFLNYFGIGPAETNRILEHKLMPDIFKTKPEGLRAGDIISIFPEQINQDELKKNEIREFITKIHAEFPESRIMSATAREICEKVFDHHGYVIDNPDKKLIDWMNLEYELFSSLEEAHYFDQVYHGFKTMDEFIETANSVLNRRKSRAGKSLENNLAAIFDGNAIAYEGQVVTELNKKPDFVFPGSAAYHNLQFAAEKLIVLGAKTTCKDRWRQVITEADRVKHKYLFTLQQGNTAQQLKEMQSESVTLVVPGPYIKTYPKEYRANIMDLAKFIAFVKEKAAS